MYSVVRAALSRLRIHLKGSERPLLGACSCWTVGLLADLLCGRCSSGFWREGWCHECWECWDLGEIGMWKRLFGTCENILSQDDMSPDGASESSCWPPWPSHRPPTVCMLGEDGLPALVLPPITMASPTWAAPCRAAGTIGLGRTGRLRQIRALSNSQGVVIKIGTRVVALFTYSRSLALCRRAIPGRRSGGRGPRSLRRGKMKSGEWIRLVYPAAPLRRPHILASSGP